MRANHGVITVTLDGTEYELRPTLKACRKINAKFGGLRGALESLHNLDFDAIAFIVSAGAEIVSKQAMEDVAEAVYCDIAAATEQVIPFIEALFDPTGKNAKDEPAKKSRAKEA